MNVDKYKFVWEKWHTPVEDYHQSMLYGEHPAEAIDEDEFEEVEEHEQIYLQQRPIIPVQIIQTLAEQNKFLESFDFWVLHTNFDISKDIQSIAESTEGVESFQTLTRYRAKVGLTKAGLFDNSEVKHGIQKNILAYFNDDIGIETTDNVQYVDLAYFDLETQEKINSKQEDLNKEGAPWSMFVFPNGSLSSFQHTSADDMANKIDFLSQMQTIIGGYILSSDEDMGYNT